MIIVEPNFGLANRMRVIASAMRLSERTSQEVSVAWEQTHELNCSFRDLFMPIPTLQVIPYQRLFRFIKANDQATPVKRFLASTINQLLGIDYCVKFIPEANEVVKHKEQEIFEMARRYKNLYIKTCGEFGENDAIYALFKPTPELQQRIQDRIALYTDRTFGLHIRRSDHVDAIANSPFEAFTAIIDQEINNSPDTKFYLSTDDAATELQLKRKYGSRIMAYAKDYSRNSSQGIKDALVDLYCLAHTRKIYGSYNSSFSDIASRIYGIELDLVTKKNSQLNLV